MVRVAVALIALAAAAQGSPAQEPAATDRGDPLPFSICTRLGPQVVMDLAGTAEELVRWGGLTGEFRPRARSIRRPSDGVADPACPNRTHGAARGYRFGPVRVAPAAARLGLWSNSGYPDDRNNGALWAGRGISASASAGVRVQAGPLSAGVVPVLTYSENRPFAMREAAREGFSPYANPFYRIDLPQRFGGESYAEAKIGQSYVRLDGFGVAAGVSTENMWVGPGARYSLLMTNTAPGFRHVFLGTTRPIDLWIARVDGEMVLGWLEESEYFDENPANDENRLALWVVTIRPRWLDGLELGFARSYMHVPPADESILGELFRPSERNLPGNELASIFGRWVFPEAGAEIYAEWGRDDRYANIVGDLIPEPDHSQAYMLGFQKLTDVGETPLGPMAVRVKGELVHLQEKQEYRTGRPLPVWYTHSGVTQGYTHQGQVMGAAVGPGGDAQFVGVDGVFPWGTVGLFGERVRRNDASAEALRARFAFPYEHDTELVGGLRGKLFLRPFVVSASLAYGTRWDRDFLQDDSNLKARLHVEWWPGGRQ